MSKKFLSNMSAFMDDILGIFPSKEIDNVDELYDVCDKIWEYTIDGEYVILNKYVADATNVTVPNIMTINGTDYKVKLKCGEYNEEGVGEYNELFANTKNVSTVVFSDGIDCSELYSMRNMFINSSVESVTFGTPSAYPSHVSFNGLFYQCRNLKSVDLTPFYVSSSIMKIINCGSMFYYCDSLEGSLVVKLNTEYCTSFAYMFEKCKNLTHINIKTFNWSSTKSRVNMFAQCTSLKYIFMGFETANTLPSGVDDTNWMNGVSAIMELI